MRNRILALAAVAMALGGCTTPLTMPEPPAIQYRMTYARDWDALAGRTAADFTTRFQGQTSPVFVSPGPPDMAFAVSYRKFLETAFLNRGVRVDTVGTDATVLSFDVQTFRYKNERDKTPVEYATFGTTFAAMGRMFPTISSVDTGAALIASAGPAADLFASFFRGTKVQVVLTLTATRGTQLAYRDMQIFYIEPTELPFYWTRQGEFIPQAKAIADLDERLPIHAGQR